MAEKSQLTIQAWGNSLAVRIPARVAKASRLALGQSVALEVIDGAVVVRPEGKYQHYYWAAHVYIAKQ